MGRITSFFLAVGAYDRMPPGVCGKFALLRLFLSHQTGGHVWDAVDILPVEGVIMRIFCVEKDVVVLGRPAVSSPPTEIVRPDDLVQEVFPPKDLIEQDFAVMCLSEIDVEIQTARLLENPVGFQEPGFKKGAVILETVAIIPRSDELSAVALIPKTDPITRVRTGGFELPA